MRLATTLKIAVVATVVFAGVLVGCATDNGDATLPEETSPPARDTGSGSDDTTRPEFDASFPSDPDAGSGRSDAGSDGGACVDKDDPGGAENVATVLPPTDDCDNDYKTTKGIVQSPVDVDFYKLSAADKTFCSLDTDFEAKTAGTELCVFARCKNSTVDAVTGCAQGAQATSDLGMKGCCTSAPGHAIPNWDCSGITDDDSADFVIRVKADDATAACLPYELRYRY